MVIHRFALSVLGFMMNCMDRFIFTPENLIENIHKIGAWSIYGLATEALKYYFPDEYDEYNNCKVEREIELLQKMKLNCWQDVVIKYQKEVGYVAPDGFNTNCVNER